MNNQEARTEINIASPGARIIAYIIDALIGMAILEIVVLSIVLPAKIEVLLDSLLRNLILLIFLYSVIMPLVNSILISKLGGTIGKLLTGTRIVNNKGSNLGFLRALFRNYIGYTISKTFLWLGFIWILINKQRRAWHDLIIDSWVVTRYKFGLILGLFSMIILLAFNIFLGQTIYQKFNQNRNFYYGIFKELSAKSKVQNLFPNRSSLP